MKIDFNQALEDFDGKPVVFAAQKEGEATPLLLKRVATEALLNAAPEMGDQARVKIAHFELARRVHTSTDSIDLRAEDIALIKDVVSKYWSTLVVGLAFELLDPPS
jgi:hypothetical protein